MRNFRSSITVVALVVLVWTNDAPAQYSGQSNFQDAAGTVAPASYAASPPLARELEAPKSSGFPSLARPASTDPTATEEKTSKNKSFGPLVTTGFSLVVVLGLFAGLVWVTRRYGNASMTQTGVPSDVMKSLGSTAIDARTRVTLLRCGNRIIVMAQTATGVHPLSEITDPIEVQQLTAMCKGETISPTSLQAEPTFAEALRQANHPANRQPANMAFNS